MKKLRLKKEIKEKLNTLLGILMIYTLIIGGVIVVNARFEQLNNQRTQQNER